MSNWIKEVPRDAIVDGSPYFLARKHSSEYHTSYMYVSRDIKGRTLLSVKPGIAIRFTSAASIAELLSKYPEFVVIEVPKDADKRWKRRVKRYY